MGIITFQSHLHCLSEKKPEDRIARIVHARYDRSRHYRSTQRMDKGKSIDEWQAICERACARIHEPTELQTFKHMVGYMPVSAFKVDGTAAALLDLITPVIEAPFSIDPTPEPTLSRESVASITRDVVRELRAIVEANGLALTDLVEDDGVNPDAEEFIRERAKAAALVRRNIEKRMSERAMKLAEVAMRDMFLQSSWKAVFSDFLRNGLKHMAAFIRGPEYVRKPIPVWQGNAYRMQYRMVPEFRVIDYAFAFPSPDADYAWQGEGFTEAYWTSINDLYVMRDDPGYDRSQIQRIIEAYPNKKAGWTPVHSGLGRPNDLRAAGLPRKQGDARILRLIHQGTFSGRELADAGITGYALDELHDIEAEVIGNVTIRVRRTPSPGGHRNVYSCSFRPDGGVYGKSIPYMLHDTQTRVNRLYYWSMLAAMQQAGAFYMIDPRFVAGEQNISLMPFHQIRVNNAVGAASPVTPVQSEPTFQMLWNQMLAEIQLADHITGVSVMHYAQPEGPVLRTATSMSLLYGAASKQIKAYLNAIDTYVLPPMLSNAYRMLIEERKDLRFGADARIGSKGLHKLMAREATQVRLAESLQFVTNGAAAGVVPPELVRATWRMFLDTLGLPVDEYMPDVGSEEQIRAALAAETPATDMTVDEQTPVPAEALTPNIQFGDNQTTAL